ncbi:MAG: phosphoserine phosphatase SerB [Deltaproteobacteria bacterium]|nr:phosphoserine phosphatase SerB [Deltaproteobacteria bacterium]
MPFTPSTTLITVTGTDRPGITAGLTARIAHWNLNILDMEQVVVEDLLSLSILMAPPQGEISPQALEDLRDTGKTMGLEVNIRSLPPGQAPAKSSRRRYFLTLISHNRLHAAEISRVTGLVADNGFNIDRIQRLDNNENRCLEFIISTSRSEAAKELKQKLLPIGRVNNLDIAIQPDTLFRRVKRLVVFDMDSTLIQGEVIDELAKLAGVGDQVAHITHQAMDGQLDFKQSLKKRVALLEGLPVQRLEEAWDSLPLTPGAEDLIRVLKRLGFKTALISGGFTCFAEQLQARLGLDYAYANTLEIHGGKLTGQVKEPVIDGEAKADLLEKTARKEGIHLDQVVAIGDGANDLPMLGRAGLGIAFNAKPMVRDAAEHSISQSRLDDILFLLGISQADISALPAD